MRRYDFDGNVLWTRQLGGTDDDFANHMAVGASGVYVVGTTRGALPGQPGQGSGNRDAFLLKYDTAGNLLWTRQFGSVDYNWDYGTDVAVDATGVYVSGMTFGTLPGQTSAGYADAYVRKYGTDGNEVWTQQFGTRNYDEAIGITVDATGVYVVGEAQDTLSGQPFAGNPDAFVRKYSKEGNELWTREFGTPGSDYAWKVTQDATGVYVAGFVAGALPGQASAGGQDAFVRKYDQNGNEVWTRQFGTPAEDFAMGITASTTGLYVAGYADGTLPGQVSAGGRDAFVAKISRSSPKPAELVIDGDQSGPTNDQIDVRLDPDGKLFQVDVNGRAGVLPSTRSVPSRSTVCSATMPIRVEGTAARVPVAVDAGDGNDVIDIGLGTLNGLQAPLTVNGGGGDNALNIDDSASPAPPAGRYTYLVSAQGVQRLWAAGITYSGMGQVLLKGSDTASNYVITSSAVAAPVSITAGAGDDVFAFLGAARLAGTIDGGAGVNTLDYSNYNQVVKVNLAAGTATGTAGIANIQNVIGGQAGSLLVGNDSANVLKGGAGRNVIIGGGGADTLNAGKDGDLLIGGTTAYDQNTTALDAILAAWRSNDLGTVSSYLKWGDTVKDDGAVDTLTGGNGVDWFWVFPGDIYKKGTGDEVFDSAPSQ